MATLDPTTSALTAILVPAGQGAALEAERVETASQLDALRSWPCETLQDETDLAEILLEIKSKAKELDQKRTTVTGPLNQAKRAVDALFKPALDVCAEAEGIIKGKLSAAVERRMAANRAAIQAATAQAAQGNTHGAAAALATVSTAQAAGVSNRLSWEATLEDISQVPRDWLTVDWSRVRIYTKEYAASEEIPSIPGLRFTRKATIVAGPGRPPGDV